MASVPKAYAAPLSCAFLESDRALRPMTIHNDVLQLQRLLNNDPDTQVAKSGPGSLGNETTKYGRGTFLAMKNFQEKYRSDILTPYGRTVGTGFYGPATKAKLLAVCKAMVGTSTQTVAATSTLPLTSTFTPTQASTTTSVLTLTSSSSTALPPTVSFFAAPYLMNRNESSLVSWSSFGATSCVTPWGSTATSGIYTTPLLAQTTIYNISCVGSGGISTATTTISVVGSTQVVALPTAHGLIASYNMNEGGGAVLIDRSNNGRNGTLVSTPTWAAGKNSGGLTFDGADKVDLASQLPIQGIPQLTISAWVKRAAPGSAVEIGKQGGANSTSIELWTDGTAYFAISAGAGAYGTVSLNDANWHYVSMVFDGNQTGNTNRLKGYVDGVLQTLAFTGVIPSLTTVATDSFGLGSLNGKYSNGQIDDVRIYNRPLTASEISADMNNSVVETTTPVPLPFSTLDQRMQLFRDGALHGFALASLPDNGIEPYSEVDYQDLAATGANVIRVPIILRKALSGDRYDIPEADISYAQNALSRGARYGFRVVVVLVALPWGDAPSDYWGNASLMTDLASKWALIAGRLKGYGALQAYDMINEPVITGVGRVSGLTQWHDLAVSLGQAIQAVDSNTPIMFEPHPWGLPGSFWQAAPLGLSGVVYSFHMYEPATFTSQGINGYPEPVVYPGIGFSSTTLYDYMLEARTIAARDSVPMFIGEFSCLRWGPGCTQYLTDVTTQFGNENWGWTYHAWRNYQGWDAEIPSTISQVQAYPSGVQYRTSTSTSFVLLKNKMVGNQTFFSAQ